MAKTRQAGFTLVELLVVISIIALLLSVLMPTLNKAREMGKSTTCKATFRQFSMANIMYAQECKGYTIPIKDSTYLNGYGGGWWVFNIKLRELMGIKPADHKSNSYVACSWPKGLICPNAKTALAWGKQYGVPKGGRVGHIGYSFALNCEPFDPSTAKDILFKGEQIKNPSDKIQGADAIDYKVRMYESDRYIGEDLVAYGRAGYAPYQIIAYRHGAKNKQTTNVVFYDGHVDAPDRKRVVNNASMWKLK